MDGRPAVILSPHLDDAVLSCWHLLAAPGEVRVVNVFAGTPDPGSGLAMWDRLSGASDSGVRMAERRAEDRAALAVVGRAATNLTFLDAQYEPSGQTVEAIAASLRRIVRPEEVVYAPAALGDHADHEAVRSAALLLAGSGQVVRLYADHPHAARWGWPAWVDGAERRSGPDVELLWNERLREVGLPATRPALHRLSDAARKRKLAAASAYRTQLAALEVTFGRIDGFPALPYEFVWSLS